VVARGCDVLLGTDCGSTTIVEPLIFYVFVSRCSLFLFSQGLQFMTEWQSNQSARPVPNRTGHIAPFWLETIAIG
jgi:hypothetical protein